MTEDNRIPEIRAVLARWQQYRAMPIKTLPEWSMAESLFANIEEILDSASPAPRVWFPGDTVPAGTALMLEDTEGTDP